MKLAGNKKFLPVLFGLFIFAPLLGYNSSSLASNFLDLGKKITAYFEKIKTQTSGQSQQNLNVAPVSPSDLNIKQSGAADSDQYLSSLAKALSSGFSNDEFNAMKKDAKGRPFSLEEIALRLAYGANQSYFKDSLKAWQNLDERGLEALKETAVNQNLASNHAAIVSWYKYHAGFAQKLAGENLSTLEIKNLYDQHQKNAGIFNQRLQTAFAKPKLLAENEQDLIFDLNPFLAIFSNLIPTALAQSTAPVVYNFGGYVTVIANVCTTGIGFVVSQPRGGLLWIYYGVWALNPYIYKNLTPSTAVLGKAAWGPGVCNQGYVTYAYGMAQVIYFGSAAVL